MKINTKIRYGLRTVIEIAIHGNNGILQKEIAKKQHLSDKYLDHIIASLKAGGIITNVAGKGSGYMLTKAPEHISVYDVYRSFDNELSITNCLSALAH
ncbi:MAG: RrF2 family transcriptional regulator, partial [Bacteroidota bacterium]